MKGQGKDWGSNTIPGDPENWARRIARSHADLGQAMAELRGSMDDANMDFALPEFIRERIVMVTSTLR